MIVMKFGGTSVKDGAAMDRACAIVEERIAKAPLVIVSALSGVTSSLIEAAQLAGQGSAEPALAIFHRLRALHLELLPELEAELELLRRTLVEVAERRYLTPQMEDRIASFGEMLSSRIFASRLSRRVPTTHVDARQCIITDNRFTRAHPIYEETERRAREIIQPLLRPGAAVVAGGYIGSTTSGETSTLGRGGSDFSASLLGACLDAEEVEIWTDVDGMMTADPRVVGHAWTIKNISFAEASELAYFGAKVLHPSTLLPAVKKGIPVHVLNSRRPDGAGTVITSEARVGHIPVKSLASKRGLTAITIMSSRMLMAHGFLKALFEVFDRHRTSVDVVTTSEVSVSLTTDDSSALDAIVGELGRLGNVQVETGLALVCMVGANLKDRRGIAAQAFGCLDDINIRMISQGASHINLSFVISEAQADIVIRRLHDQFFKEFEPEVFARVD